MKQIRTWRNAVVAVNRNIRSGKPACLGVKNGSVLVSDGPIPGVNCEYVFFSEVSEKELKSDILDRLLIAHLSHDNAAVQDILNILASIGQWEVSKWD